MRHLRKAAAMLLTLAMLVGMVAVPAAAVEKPALTTSMEQVEGDIYKLSFKITSNGLNAVNVLFSFDNAAITPVNANSHAEVDVTKAKPSIQVELMDAADTAYGLLISGLENGGRSALSVSMYPTDPDYKNESELNDTALFSFYFKLSGELAKGSFKIETDKSEGSFLSLFYKTPEALANASGALLSDKTGTNYIYNKDAADTLNIDLTYIGSDKQTIDTVTLSADPTAVVVNGAEVM